MNNQFKMFLHYSRQHLGIAREFFLYIYKIRAKEYEHGEILYITIMHSGRRVVYMCCFNGGVQEEFFVVI